MVHHFVDLGGQERINWQGGRSFRLSFLNPIKGICQILQFLVDFFSIILKRRAMTFVIIMVGLLFESVLGGMGPH